jgi:MoaA/NifB/PqqE/SkfB family radical SAM enzyme
MNNIDHIDIVVTHKCNFNCPFCIDKFRGSSDKEIDLQTIDNWLGKIKQFAKPGCEVLLLGGDPMMLDVEKLIDIAKIIKSHGFSPIMSTNGSMKDNIKRILPYYDWIQITVYNQSQIDYWHPYKDKINIKLSGDSTLNMERLEWFDEATKDFVRRSISMYFTPEFEELCKDAEIWNLINGLEWKRNGSYMYAFWNGIRFKKCIHGETNIIDEPSVPKLYPNGNYNKTWNNEDMDNYLNI